MRPLRAILALILGLALTACGGSGLSGQSTCTSAPGSQMQVNGECVGVIDTLAEAATQHLAVKTSEKLAYTTVAFTVTVGAGTVGLTFVDTGGNVQNFTAAPDAPATGTLTVQLDTLNQINFELKPLAGSAMNVNYHLSYQCACKPQP